MAMLLLAIVAAICLSCQNSAKVTPPMGHKVRIFEGRALKNGDRRFGIDYFEPDSGERTRIIVGTYDAARSARSKMENDLNTGAYRELAAGEGRTITDLQKLWFEDRAEKRSLSTDKHRWRYFDAFFGGDKEIDDVHREHALAFRKFLMSAKTRTKRPMRPATVNRTLVLGKAAWNLAIDHKWTRENPFSTIRLLHEDNQRVRLCSEDEFTRLSLIAAPKLLLAMQIARDCGLRAGEIAGLRWDQIDLDEGVINVLRTKTDRARVVPMSEAVTEALQEWPRSVDGRIMHITSGGISSEFHDACLRARIEGLQFRDLRATAVTQWIRDGVDSTIVRRLIGHVTMTTIDRYARLIADDLKLALQAAADRKNSTRAKKTSREAKRPSRK